MLIPEITVSELRARNLATLPFDRVLIDLLGAYADGELPPETTSQIDAHLVGCVRCRRELAVHRAMRRRLPRPILAERIRCSVGLIRQIG